MSSDRGQLILIGAVLVAVAILGSVVLLNVLHVPADIDSQQDARSLAALERTTPQVSAGLERLFLVHTSVSERSQRVPYARDGGPDPDFEKVVGNYNDVNADLTASAGSRVVSVEYLGPSGASVDGTFVRHNGTGNNLTTDGTGVQVLRNAETMPYFYLNVTGHNESNDGIRAGETFTVNIDGETLTFEQGAVDPPNALEVSGSHSDLYPAEVEIVGGHGEIRSASGVRSFNISTGSNFHVTFEDGNMTMGSYTISGTGSPTTGIDTGRDHVYEESSVIVNPRFRMNVTDASVTHSRTFTLYNRTHP